MSQVLVGKSMGGEAFDLTSGPECCCPFPKTLLNMRPKGDSCHCNITYFSPTEKALFDLLLEKTSSVSSSNWTGFREPHDTTSSHFLPQLRRISATKEKKNTEMV